MIDIEELKKLAEATLPREWFARNDKLHASFGLNTSEVIFDMNSGRGDHEWMVRRRAELAYIAAANPQAVLALIQQNESLQAKNEGLRAKTAITMGVGDGSGQLFVHGDYESIKACQAIIDENAALRKELEEARKDAALYQALRSMHWSDGKLTVIAAKNVGLGVQTYSGDLLDAEIAARKQEPT